MRSFDRQWLEALQDILTDGDDVSPRGVKTKDIPHRAIQVLMRESVLLVPERKLSYQFMAAEAYWILSGSDKVADVAPWNKRISEFSDDGVRFFGAYGPKIKDQLPFVVSTLTRDPDSRQAGLTIWRESPPKTKDVPCTVAMFFRLNQGYLDAHVFMRSNDVWLGMPYDVFNFSMVAHLVCCRLNEGRSVLVSPGTLYLTAASSHLYETNWTDARKCATVGEWRANPPKAPDVLYADERILTSTLRDLRDTKPGSVLRWWEK